ncbi:hypothetical protein SAMN05443248_8031 [Bradyrhizobium erythrophlei]|uniref:Uncharacterized protein n=1 Tax=Bradyrhizobium erythrophlei TaxID=1437360 RepID=A0A1M5Y891_9BRAD|nr:hypothetical protein SAMN05443248_8031 [Bradyrhizobium erythrophlei]
MREADVGSPSADTGRAISDYRISRPGLIWRRGSQSLMGNFEGSNRSSRLHWHQPGKGRCSDTDDHLLTWQQGLLGILCRMERQDRQKPTSPRCVRCLSSPRVCLTRRPGGRFTCSNACAVLELGFQRRCKAASVGGLFSRHRAGLPSFAWHDKETAQLWAGTSWGRSLHRRSAAYRHNSDVCSQDADSH